MARRNNMKESLTERALEFEKSTSPSQVLSPYEIYKDPDKYEKYLRQKAEVMGVKLTYVPNFFCDLNGSGRAITVGKSGRKYLGKPVFEPFTEIIFQGSSPLSKVHELTHAEQRLINPTWEGTSLSQIEIEASERALRVGRGIGHLYPGSIINQNINLTIHRFLNLFRAKIAAGGIMSL